MQKFESSIGVILAAGKGSRLKCTDRNKTSLLYHNKPLVQYGVDLYQASNVEKIVIVIGAFAESVINSVNRDEKKITFVKQPEQLGTGNALKVAFQSIQSFKDKPEFVFVGYGDHMMHYQPEQLLALKSILGTNRKAVISLITTVHHDPDSLAWGRIIRNNNKVIKIVEQKDATETERSITELNAGFYCFRYEFLETYLDLLRPSKITGEYYLTDLIAEANRAHLEVYPLVSSFKTVGFGVNTLSELQALSLESSSDKS